MEKDVLTINAMKQIKREMIDMIKKKLRATKTFEKETTNLSEHIKC